MRRGKRLDDWEILDDEFNDEEQLIIQHDFNIQKEELSNEYSNSTDKTKKKRKLFFKRKNEEIEDFQYDDVEYDDSEDEEYNNEGPLVIRNDFKAFNIQKEELSNEYSNSTDKNKKKRKLFFKRKNEEIEDFQYDDVEYDDSEYDDSEDEEYDLINKKEKNYELDNYIVITEKSHQTLKRVVLSVIVCLLIVSSFVGFGYLSTDFDENGNAYIVPLELKYERAYTKESDELLNYILLINETLEADAVGLKTDYVNMSAKLNTSNAQLKQLTTDFSKYIGVPKSYESYHSMLINFSLSTQTFIDKLINNSSDSNFDAFLTKGFQDYYQSLDKVVYSRQQIELLINRNKIQDENANNSKK